MSEGEAAEESAAQSRKRVCPCCGRTIFSDGTFLVQVEYHQGEAYCLKCHAGLRARIDSVSRALESLLLEVSGSEALEPCAPGGPPPESLEELKRDAALLDEKIHEARDVGVDGALLERARVVWIKALEASVSARQAAVRAEAEEEEEGGNDEAEGRESLVAEPAGEADRRLLQEQARFAESMAAAAGRDAPPWVTDEEFLGSLRGPVRIEDTALRGVSLGRVLSLAGYVQHCLQRHDVVDTDRGSPTEGQRIRWESINMYQVCTQFVMPLTRKHGCSYVELVGEGDGAAGVPPLWMTSHWWGTSFAQTISMLKCHAQARYGGIDTHSPEETTYWICTLANNQHDIDSELNEDNMMNTPFARAMLKASCQGTVLLCDPGVRVLERAWCIMEIHITEQLRRMPAWAPEEIRATDGVHFLDVVSPVTSRDLPEGLEEPEGGCAAMFLDVGEDGWHEHATLPALRFPLRVAQNGVLINMIRSEASKPEDWRRIMNFVALKRVSHSTPPAQHQEYVKLNLFIHEVFYSAELFRLCLELPEDAVIRAKELVMKGASPNKIVRRGNTPFFAAVGAEQLHDYDEGQKAIQRQMVELLLASGADPNVANNSMNTALDCVRDEDIERLLKERGCKTFGEMAPRLEKAINRQLRTAVKAGCGRLDTFSGSGGGGLADRLSAEGLKSLQSAAALMHRYPGAPCTISVRQQRRTANGVAEVTALARARKVQAVLQAAGCRNPFRLETSCPLATPVPPAVAIRMDLQRMDKIKGYGGAILLGADTSPEAEGAEGGGRMTQETDSESAGDESEAGSEHSTGSDWDRVTRLFQRCDSDGSGTISREELERVLLSVKPDLTQEEMTVMFNCADADRNEKIDRMEFLAWINSSDPAASELKEQHSGPIDDRLSTGSSPSSTKVQGDRPDSSHGPTRRTPS